MFETGWQKLSPIAVLFYVARTWYHVLGNVFSWLIPLIVFRQYILEHLLITSGVVIGLLALSILWAWVSYRMVSYQLDNNGVDLRTGVFNKQLLQLPFDRVQNVRIEHPWYFRLTGHCQLILESAGSSDQEIMLVALKPEFAERIKAEVLAVRTTVPSAHNPPQHDQQHLHQQHQDATLLNQRSVGDLVMYGIGSNRGWLIIGGLFPFYGYIEDRIEPLLYQLGIFNDGSLPIWQWLVTLLALFAMLMFVLTLFSIVIAVISYYDFKLYRDGDRYLARMGLLSRKEVAMPISRIQEVSVQQDWLDMLLRRRQLRYSQVGGMFESKNILVPAVTSSESQALLDDVYAQRDRNIKMTQASKWLLAVYATWYWLPLVALTTTVVVLLAGWSAGVWMLVPAVLLAGLYYLRWRRWGYAMDGEFIYLQSGWLGKKTTLIPLAKLQQPSLLQTPLMRRRGLMSIDWVTAGGVHRLPFINEAQARAMYDFALFEIEAKSPNWM